MLAFILGSLHLCWFSSCKTSPKLHIIYHQNLFLVQLMSNIDMDSIAVAQPNTDSNTAGVTYNPGRCSGAGATNESQTDAILKPKMFSSD
jgi:hypothetical protein